MINVVYGGMSFVELLHFQQLSRPSCMLSQHRAHTQRWEDICLCSFYSYLLYTGWTCWISRLRVHIWTRIQQWSKCWLRRTALHLQSPTFNPSDHAAFFRGPSIVKQSTLFHILLLPHLLSLIYWLHLSTIPYNTPIQQCCLFLICPSLLYLNVLLC